LFLFSKARSGEPSDLDPDEREMVEMPAAGISPVAFAVLLLNR
jgi:hypothetical protein